MYENVNYTYYSDTLGRSLIPDEATFNRYKLEEIAYIKTLEPYIIAEREENGKDSAACMFIEVAYKSEINKNDGRKVQSVSIDGYSESYQVEKVKTPAEEREKWLNLFCVVSYGVM